MQVPVTQSAILTNQRAAARAARRETRAAGVARGTRPVSSELVWPGAVRPLIDSPPHELMHASVICPWPGSVRHRSADDV